MKSATYPIVSDLEKETSRVVLKINTNKTKIGLTVHHTMDKAAKVLTNLYISKGQFLPMVAPYLMLIVALTALDLPSHEESGCAVTSTLKSS